MERYEHDGLVFDVSDQGPRDGRVIIALHGFPEDRHCWDQLGSAITDAGYRTVAPDQRGYSPGARPPGRRAYRLELLAGDVLALADQLGASRFDVVGHDWGAVVAWYLAVRRPDRVRTLSALSVPHPQAFLAAMTRSSQVLHSWYMAFFQLPWLPEQMMTARAGSRLSASLVRSGLDRGAAERYARRAAGREGMSGPINWYRALPFDARNRLGKVSVPTLYFWGARDRFVTRTAAESCAAQVVGRFKFVALESQSHWLPTGAAHEMAPTLLQHLAAVGG